MKITCGTDIIEIERIKENIENIGQKFLDKIYTKKEIEYCESKKIQKYQHYAVRFAAKEAVFKAVSVQLEDKYSICWKDIEISNDTEFIQGIDISLSHCKEYAVANVVVIWN